MPSPSERYAAARQRQRDKTTRLAQFAASLPFTLDDFQVRACEALERGEGVLVAAPTGSGKTVVGEFAVDLALGSGTRAFYTTPIKALSNQKYTELLARHGAGNVGLLTGDNSIDGDAPVVVMTTEVLRNMIYEGSAALDGLRYVVMDEVHYLADRWRGAVWEEVLIQLPESVTVAALSATVSNAEEFGEWLRTVRGATAVIVEEHRPVPLYQHVAAGSRLLDLFTEGNDINPELRRLAQDDQAAARLGRRRGYQRRGPRAPRTPSRAEVIDRLDRADLLPAITFIFSRAGCDAAASQVALSGLRLTSPAEAEQIRVIAETRCSHLPVADLNVLGFESWVDMLSRGIAAHHAGMLPAFKEVVEELFQKGLIKCVFATETLALGINMPARSVALEKLTKWNGETHAEITPGEYTQLTGRAGRRGIDVEGHAVVVWHPGLDPNSLAGLASTRTYPLRSSFHPSYNMAVNLVGRMGYEAAREVLETSFAQFQADRSVVGIAAQLRRQEEAAAGYREAMTCHLGDFVEYAELRERLGQREKELSRRSSAAERRRVAESLAALRRGDIIVVPAGRRSGPAVVVDPALADDDPRPQVVTVDRQLRRVAVGDFPSPVTAIAAMRIPRSFAPRSASARRDLALALREATRDVTIHRPRARRRSEGAADAEVASLRTQLRQHPCHGCSDREAHARWAQRYHRLQREIAGLQRRGDQRGNSIARQFDRVCAVLFQLGYLTTPGPGTRPTPAGQVLARIYNDDDLLATEAIRSGLWSGLGPAQLAAVASALVYEGRTDEPVVPRINDQRILRVLRDQAAVLADLKEVEAEHRLSFLGRLDAGFAAAAHGWVAGKPLDKVLFEADMAPGDFVRWCKQLADLLDQVAAAADAGPGEELRTAARAAVQAIRRGVVAYSSTV